MGLREMFRMEKKPGEKIKLEEQEIMALKSESGESIEAFVVGEPIRLMGRLDYHDNPESQIVSLEKDDEISVSDAKFYPEDDYDIKIQVWNAENPTVAKALYFRKAELVGRKIKINTAAKPKFAI